MGLKKSGLKKENSRPQDSGLFGVIDKVIPAILRKKTIKDPQIPLNYKARKLAQGSVLEAEYRKAKAITLIRRTPMR
jgi:hypothetical protein